MALVLSVLTSAAVPAQAPVRTPTPVPRLSGGFGRPQTTAPPSHAADPDGSGLTIEGPLAFDTTGYDWGAYGADLVQRIKSRWDVPQLARLGWKGSLAVRFQILANGTVADAKIIRSSGVPPFDNAAVQAVLKSSPLAPLPAELHHEREGVMVTFSYNLRPESVPGGARGRISSSISIPARMTPSASRPTPALSLPPPRIAELPATFDQPEFHYPVYVQRMVAIISVNWFKPAQSVQTSPVVHFQIERDGTITSPRIVTSSGLPFVDRAALRAVLASSPLPALPSDYVGRHLGIQVVFE
jgi:TonB family protein